MELVYICRVEVILIVAKFIEFVLYAREYDKYFINLKFRFYYVNII